MADCLDTTWDTPRSMDWGPFPVGAYPRETSEVLKAVSNDSVEGKGVLLPILLESLVVVVEHSSA